MKYKVQRQFVEPIWKKAQTYEDLSTYLSEHKIRNIVDHSIVTAPTVKGQVDSLELKVTFRPSWNYSGRKVKTQMTGVVTTLDIDTASQRKATELLTLLAQYMPNHLKK